MKFFNKVLFLSIIIVSLSITRISLSQFPTSDNDDLRYRVSVGDSQTYEFKKYYETDELSSSPTVMTDENGEEFNVSMKKGTRFKVIITALNESDYDDDGAERTIYMKMEIQGRKTQETSGGGYVWPTTDNRSYWEDYFNSSELSRGSFEGNIVTYNFSSSSSQNLVFFIRMNILTGWTTVIYQKMVFENGTLSRELLLESVSSYGILDIPLRFFQSISLEMIGSTLLIIVSGTVIIAVIRNRGQSSDRSIFRPNKKRIERQGEPIFITKAPHSDVIQNIDTLIDELEDQK
ncbi:MAG: hypothetical protein ACXAC7_14495 [Candidatus Hodarchaeales archaeon]